MKKTILGLVIVLSSVVSVYAQCNTIFPLHSGNAGRVKCDSAFRYSAVFVGTTEDFHTTLGIAVRPQSSTKLDEIRSNTWLLDCKPSSQKLNSTKFSLINYKYNESAQDYDYFIAEFNDTSKHNMLAIAYGSSQNKVIEDGVKESYLLPIDRVDCWARLHKSAALAEKEIYNHPNGSYLYEIYDKDALCGIRYYSLANKQEYKMFFK